MRDIGIASYFVSRNYEDAETLVKSIGNFEHVVTAIIGSRQRINVCIMVMKRLQSLNVGLSSVRSHRLVGTLFALATSPRSAGGFSYSVAWHTHGRGAVYFARTRV